MHVVLYENTLNMIKDLIELSKPISIAPIFTQGGGGNTSVKYNDEMLIKASGFRLDEITDSIGYVSVQYKEVQSYFKANKTSSDNHLKEFVKKNTISTSNLLASMETGFHAVLSKYVIHTHPIAANYYLCCKEGNSILKSIFNEYDFEIIPYVNPGYALSKHIAEMKNKAAIMFLQNHGIIIHSNNKDEALHLHQKVMNLLPVVPQINYSLNQANETEWILTSDKLSILYTERELLKKTYFPDQAVVIGQSFCFEKQSDVKINFISNEKCILNVKKKEALAIAENLLALASIIEYSKNNSYTLQSIPDAEVAYILGLDMEKYRQQLLKN